MEQYCGKNRKREFGFQNPAFALPIDSDEKLITANTKNSFGQRSREPKVMKKLHNKL